jgi:hypothetical protein
MSTESQYPGGQDVLIVMRHWVATPPCQTAARVVRDEAEIAEYREKGWTVTGPFVLEAEHSQVAVDLLREARAILPHGAFAGHRHDERHDLIARIDFALGGK